MTQEKISLACWQRTSMTRIGKRNTQPASAASSYQSNAPNMKTQMQEYDITNLSHAEVQIAGYAIEQYHKRVCKKLDAARDNLAFQEDCARKYGQRFWKDHIKKESDNIAKLISERHRIAKILGIIKVR
jgi:hypothetical protein